MEPFILGIYMITIFVVFIFMEFFGKVRYMNDKGLERKFDMNLYFNRIRI